MKSLKQKVAIAAVGLMGVAGVAGTAGVAGAATTKTHSHAAVSAKRHVLADKVHAIAVAGALPTGFSCAKAPALEAKITTASGKISARLTKAQAAEAKAVAANDTAKADAILKRIAQADQVNHDLAIVSGLLTAKCG